MAKKSVPKYRRQKSKKGDRAFVELGGTRRYLGEFGTSASREAYARALAEWEASGGQPAVTPEDITIVELAARYWSHAEVYYRKRGEPTGEQGWIRLAMRPLVALYGSTAAKDFGPVRLKAVRKQMESEGIVRTSINARVARIVRMFFWGVEETLVPSDVPYLLRAVKRLQAERTLAKESTPVGPVPVGDVEAMLPHVSPPVRAMIKLQLLTGMRPGEVRIMRSVDLKMSGPVWEYRPSRHKNEHRGQGRVVPIGPKAQAILAPFLKADATAYLFSPINVLGCGAKHEFYTKDAYNHAISKGCRKAGVPGFGANRLRHTSATMIREEAGLDGAQAWLGHARATTTEGYAKLSLERSIELAQKFG